MLVPPNIFKAVQCAATDNGRYAVNGLYIGREKDGSPAAVAADGRILLVAKWQETKAEDYPETAGDLTHQPDFNRILQSDTAKALAKPIKTKLPRLRNVYVDESAPMLKAARPTDTGFDRSEAAVVDGIYPKYQQVVPAYTVAAPKANKDQCLKVRLDAELLKKLLSGMIDSLGGPTSPVNDKGTTLEKYFFDLEIPIDTSCPLKLTAANPEVSVTGVIMPVNPPKESK